MQDPTCNCNQSNVVWCQTSVVESDPKLAKEEIMSETTIGSDALHKTAVEYNGDLEITYKVIHGYSDPEYTTTTISSLEWDLHNAKQTQKSNQLLHSKIDNVKTIIHEAYENSEDQETLRAIAEALDIELTRTVEWTASIEVSGTIELDLLSPYDTDLEDEITDALYAESHNGNIEVTDQEVVHVREC